MIRGCASGFEPLRRICILLALAILIVPGAAHADRRYFLYTYSPFLDPPGEMELETWLTSRTGTQDAASATMWEPRAEFEYAIHGRLGSAAYLNFEKQPGTALKLVSPSVEFIYRFADIGKLPGDPAVYLETTESGSELELESKLLLAHRMDRWVTGVNLIGEFEFRHNNEELLANGDVLHRLFAGEISGGIAYAVNKVVSLGIESRYRTEMPNFGPRSASFASVGPNLNLEIGEAQFGLAVLPQVWGSPRTSGNRNLSDFEKVQVRAIFGIEL